jgi:RNA polymerase sigma-70 factor (ECF subfamily)
VIEDSDITALDNLAEKDIIGLVQELSPGYRTVFNMYVIEGYSHKEVGNILGISEGTSKSQLARAKAILQKKVQERLEENRKSFTR